MNREEIFAEFLDRIGEHSLAASLRGKTFCETSRGWFIVDDGNVIDWTEFLDNLWRIDSDE